MNPLLTFERVVEGGIINNLITIIVNVVCAYVGLSDQKIGGRITFGANGVLPSKVRIWILLCTSMVIEQDLLICYNHEDHQVFKIASVSHMVVITYVVFP